MFTNTYFWYYVMHHIANSQSIYTIMWYRLQMQCSFCIRVWKEIGNKKEKDDIKNVKQETIKSWSLRYCCVVNI